MANQPPVNPNHHEMRDTLAVCVIDVASANRVIDTNGDGVDSLQSFTFLTGKDVETMITTLVDARSIRAIIVLAQFRQSV